MQWIDQLLDSFSNTKSTSDSASWSPFNPFLLWSYYAKPWMDKLWTAYEKSQEKGFTPEDLTKCFLGPLFLRQGLSEIMLFSKICNYDKEKTMKILNWFNDILVSKCTEDPYGFNSTKILTKDDVAYLMKMFPFRPVEENEAKEASKLIHACEELSWSYYFDWIYWQCFEIYGPYELPNNRKLVLRAFTDFAPEELWLHARGFEPSTVYIYTIYENTDMKLDFLSHVITRDSLPQKMTHAMVIEHGKIFTTKEQLVELRKKIEIAAVMQGKRLAELSFEDLKAREIATRHYAYRDLFKKLELDWKPASEILETVKGKQLVNYKFPSFETQEEKKVFWKKLYDPRDSFFPTELKNT